MGRLAVARRPERTRRDCVTPPLSGARHHAARADADPRRPPDLAAVPGPCALETSPSRLLRRDGRAAAEARRRLRRRARRRPTPPPADQRGAGVAMSDAGPTGPGFPDGHRTPTGSRTVSRPTGAWVLARLLAGAPVDEQAIDGLGEPWRELAEVVVSANGTGRDTAFLEAVAHRSDAGELKAAVFEVDPSAEPPAEREPARFAALGAADVMARPDPTWSVYRHLAVGQVSVWYGRPGSTKTFELVDLSGSSATGLRWLDKHEVLHGTVVYISAEGVGGMAKRLRAWVRRRGATLERLHFIEQAPSLVDPADVDLLIAQIHALPGDVQLVVLDPLNFCLGDGDENSAGDMGKAMASLQRIARTLACHVAVAHHANRGGSEERGSSAIRAAADTMIQVTNDDGVIKLECTKQRDAEQFAPIYLRLVVVAEDDSCVVEPADRAAVPEQLTRQQQKALEALQATALDEGASNSEWMEVSGLQRSTFYFTRKRLLDTGHVERDGKRFVLSEKGRAALGSPARRQADDEESNGLETLREDLVDEQSNAARGDGNGDDSKGIGRAVQQSNGNPTGVQLDKESAESNSPMSLKARRALDSWTGLDSGPEPDDTASLEGADPRGPLPWP
jgi:hypothetical protein